MAKRDRGSDEPIIIKKYANRRLYNTATSSYVTLNYLAEMVRENIDFVVHDAKSGADITRPVLTQIIFEAEGKGQNMLPVNFLRQLISFYGDNLQALLPGYLDMTMENFTRNSEEMRKRLNKPLDTPIKQFEEMSRRNMAMFEKTMAMWNPFAGQDDDDARSGDSAPAAPAPDSGEDDIGEMKEQLDRMQRQLDKLLKTR